MLRLTMSKSALAASVNRTMASVSSARMRNPSAPRLSRTTPKPIGSEQQPDPGEHDRPAEPRPLDPAGDRAVDQKKGGEDRGILVHPTHSLGRS